ncbi:MAG: hypothetical protein ABSD63_16955 [Candidatus Korobacteraceae bacterium]
MRVAEIVLAVVNSMTLIVLIKYAIDNNTIAKNSTRQLENSRMPFVALVMKKDDERNSNWAIKNQGVGAAINIYCTRYLAENMPAIMQCLTPLAPGEDYSLPRQSDHLMTTGGFKVEYESLGGKRYRTTVSWANGDVRTKFDRVI